MLRKVDFLKVLACLSVMALASAPAFAADNNSGPNNPNNPNCSPGTVGCAANYPTTDHSDINPTKQSTAGQMSPNCSPGQPGCAANYPTTDHSDDNPLKK